MRFFFLFLVILSFLFFVSCCYASGTFVDLDYGHDISYPQCSQGDYKQIASSFGIVGINGGKAFVKNPCLQEESSWQKKLNDEPIVYLNVNGAIGGTADKGLMGPKKCQISDEACRYYNYGWQSARFAYLYSSSKGVYARQWWMDIELANSWADDIFLNRMVVLGVTDFFTSQINPFVFPTFSLGIYSTNNMWKDIMGDWKNGLPVWVATDASALQAKFFCRAKYSFTGGFVRMVQYFDEKTGLDGDIRCNLIL